MAPLNHTWPAEMTTWICAADGQDVITLRAAWSSRGGGNITSGSGQTVHAVDGGGVAQVLGSHPDVDGGREVGDVAEAASDKSDLELEVVRPGGDDLLGDRAEIFR